MLTRRIDDVDWLTAAKQLDERGYAIVKGLLRRQECEAIVSLYVDRDRFRSCVVMERHGFGRGEYRYFGYPSWQAISFTERFDNGTLRVVLANDVAIRALDTSRFAPWPDGAAFAKVAWNAVADGASVVRPGSFRQVEFMVKDAARYAATQGWGWGRWLGPGLAPYGETPAFTDECTGCHAPMRADDFVFTMPIRRATARTGLLNTEADPADDITRQQTEWRVITVSLDERSATLSTVYGNPAAIDHVRDPGPGSLGPFASGAVLASVTWSEKEDPHWFGARIPGKMLEARVITVSATVDGQPTYDCRDRAAGVPAEREAPCRREAVDAMLAVPVRP